MARRTQVFMVDDLSGIESDDVVSIRYMIDGTTYEIDLAPESSEKFHKAFQRFIKKSRIISKPTTQVSIMESGQAISDVREWCRKNGYSVGERGRIAQDALRAYLAAH